MADTVRYYLIDENGNNLLKDDDGVIYIGNDAGEFYLNMGASRMFHEVSTDLIPLTEEQAKKEADRIWGKGKHKMFG